MVFMLCAVLFLSFALYVYDLSSEELDFTFTSYC
jgi:hypothetical protein